jgi:Mg2+ and Co2+ transporter CorA
MKTAYDLPSTGRVESAGSARSPAAGVTDELPRWVRMVAPQQHEVLAAIRALELPDEVCERLHGGDVRCRVVPCGRAVLVMLPVMAPGEDRSLLLRAACTPTALITVEEEALPAIDRFISQQAGVAQAGLTPPGLFIEVLNAAVTGEGLMYLSLRRKFEALADAIEDNPLRVSPDALLAMRRQVGQLSLLWEEQSCGFMELQRHHPGIAPSDSSRELLHDLVSDADRGLKLLAQMESRLRDLRQHQLQCLQESTNRRLNMLAILSAMYLPPTLIAGIYGMNVQGIPVAKLSHGYLVVILFMATVVLGHFWFFYRRGWFK